MNVSRIVAGIVSQFMVETIWLGCEREERVSVVEG
jgi:hypothetical protein